MFSISRLFIKFCFSHAHIHEYMNTGKHICLEQIVL